MDVVLGRVFTAVIEHQDQTRDLGQERVVSALDSQVALQH